MLPSRTMFGRQIQRNPEWWRAHWRSGRSTLRGTWPGSGSWRWWWWSMVTKMMVMTTKKVILLEIRKVFAALLCIKIFLEKTLTSEEIETNGGMEGWWANKQQGGWKVNLIFQNHYFSRNNELWTVNVLGPLFHEKTYKKDLKIACWAFNKWWTYTEMW